MLLATVLRKLWIYEVLTLIFSRDTSLVRIKFVIRNFNGEIGNRKSLWSTDKLVRKVMLLSKKRDLFRKKQFH